MHFILLLLLTGTVRDETGSVLPGVSVELRQDSAGSSPIASITDARGEYRFNDIQPGRYNLAFTLINFASVGAVDVFNLLNAKDSDVDYYYTSRLRGEPLDGVNDIHFHPALPRTARLSLVVGF
jgi:hypothetical protein